jgi:alginate O-acetyltransferase complex protein AlgJ
MTQDVESRDLPGPGQACAAGAPAPGGLSRAGVVLFLALLVSVPMYQAGYHLLRGHDGFPAGRAAGWAGPWPAPPVARASLLGRLADTDRRLRRGLWFCEATVADDAAACWPLTAVAQSVCTGYLGRGSDQVWVGHDGWLFADGEVAFLSEPGFLEPHAYSSAPGEAPSEQDPLRAIRYFFRQLDRRRIVLVLLPVPDRASIYPDKLVPGGVVGSEPLQSEPWKVFIAELNRTGVQAVDVIGPLFDDAHRGMPQYLMADTRWRPKALETSAAFVAVRVRQTAQDRIVDLTTLDTAHYTSERRRVEVAGNVAQKLRLLPGGLPWRTPFPCAAQAYREAVSVRMVHDRGGKPWRPDPQAEVLLLGDDWSTLYSDPRAGSGEMMGGLAEQLSLLLQAPLDRVLSRDGSACDALRQLGEQAAAGRNPLEGKKVVIWEFAASQLAEGLWPLVDVLPASDGGAPRAGAGAGEP